MQKPHIQNGYVDNFIKIVLTLKQTIDKTEKRVNCKIPTKFNALVLSGKAFADKLENDNNTSS